MDTLLVNTYGHSLMPWMKLILTQLCVLVLILPSQGLFHHLLRMIIFVLLEAALTIEISGTLKIRCGMEKIVEGVALAVNSTTLHGSVRSSLSPPLMILSCGSAVIKILIMKIVL